MRVPGSLRDFQLGKSDQITKSFKQFAVDFIILYHDIETIFEFGEQPCHSHAVQFGEGTEKLGFCRECRNLLFAQAQNIPHHRTHGGFRR